MTGQGTREGHIQQPHTNEIFLQELLAFTSKFYGCPNPELFEAWRKDRPRAPAAAPSATEITWWGGLRAATPLLPEEETGLLALACAVLPPTPPRITPPTAVLSSWPWQLAESRLLLRTLCLSWVDVALGVDVSSGAPRPGAAEVSERQTQRTALLAMPRLPMWIGQELTKVLADQDLPTDFVPRPSRQAPAYLLSAGTVLSVSATIGERSALEWRKTQLQAYQRYAEASASASAASDKPVKLLVAEATLERDGDGKVVAGRFGIYPLQPPRDIRTYANGLCGLGASSSQAAGADSSSQAAGADSQPVKAPTGGEAGRLQKVIDWGASKVTDLGAIASRVGNRLTKQEATPSGGGGAAATSWYINPATYDLKHERSPSPGWESVDTFLTKMTPTGFTVQLNQPKVSSWLDLYTGRDLGPTRAPRPVPFQYLPVELPADNNPVTLTVAWSNELHAKLGSGLYTPDTAAVSFWTAEKSAGSDALSAKKLTHLTGWTFDAVLKGDLVADLAYGPTTSPTPNKEFDSRTNFSSSNGWKEARWNQYIALYIPCTPPPRSMVGLLPAKPGSITTPTERERPSGVIDGLTLARVRVAGSHQHKYITTNSGTKTIQFFK
eukprot:gene6847-4290_t